MTKSAVFILVFSAMVLGGCASKSGPATSTTTPSTNAAEEAAQKKGDTTKTGQVGGSAGAYVLVVPGAAPIGLDSYSVELQEYVGKTVTVTGQYSGDTLFVGKITE